MTPGTLSSRLVARAPPVPEPVRGSALISLTCWAMDDAPGRGMGRACSNGAGQRGFGRVIATRLLRCNPRRYRLLRRQRNPVVEGDAAVDGDRGAGDVPGEA